MNNSPEINHIERLNKVNYANKDFELSHIIGLNTNLNSPVLSHPFMNETILYSVGGIVIAEDLSEKNNQVFFRHGGNQISAFKISNTGRFLAVGFIRPTENLDQKLPVSIIIWDYENKRILYELQGITKGVSLIEFSQDDRFISAAALDNMFYIWEVETGYKCFSRIFEFPTNLINWTTINPNTSHKNKPDYTITISSVNGMTYLTFYFELKSMQYNLKMSKFTLPSTGSNRNFTCGVYDKSINCLFLGTSGGELCLFAIENLIYKYSFNVINNGVSALILIPGSEENNFQTSLIIGGGDGRVKKIMRQGDNLNNLKNIITNEIQLSGKITSLSLLSDKKEAVCSTSTGHIYRILTSDLTFTLHSVSHTASVNDITFNNYGKINDKCFSVDDSGNTYLWDLNDFNLISYVNGDAKAKSVFIGEDGKENIN